jgi:NAD(P)H-dependent nitrite reductase small subunit
MTANAHLQTQKHDQKKGRWIQVCNTDNLVPDSGVAALVNGQQIALFLLSSKHPDKQQVCALANRDPASGANVIARGIVGDINGEPVVAAPLYKHHFSLNSGQCLEKDDWQVQVWPTRVIDGWVEIEWV